MTLYHIFGYEKRKILRPVILAVIVNSSHIVVFAASSPVDAISDPGL